MEDNPLLTEKIVNNKDEIVNSLLIEELYKNKRIVNCSVVTINIILINLKNINIFL